MTKNRTHAPDQQTPPTNVPAVSKQNTGVALSKSEQDAVFEQDIVASDIKVPAILLGQPMSQAVKDRKVLAGQMFRNDTLRVVGEAKVGDTPEKDINLIPLKIENIWQDYAINGSDKKWVRTYGRIAANDKLDRDFTEGAQNMTRVRGVRVYGVLLEDCRAFLDEMKMVLASGGIPDLSKQLSPVSFLFKSGSFKTAASPTVKFFSDIKAFARQFPNMAPFLYALPVRAGVAKNQEGREYFQFQVLPQLQIADAEIVAMGRDWFNVMKNATVIVSEDTETDGDEGEAIPAQSKPIHTGNYI